MYHLIYHKRNSAFFRICTLNNCILIQKICILNTANLYKNTEDLYFKYRKSVLKYRLLTTLAHHRIDNSAKFKGFKGNGGLGLSKALEWTENSWRQTMSTQSQQSGIRYALYRIRYVCFYFLSSDRSKLLWFSLCFRLKGEKMLATRSGTSIWWSIAKHSVTSRIFIALTLWVYIIDGYRRYMEASIIFSERSTIVLYVERVDE